MKYKSIESIKKKYGEHSFHTLAKITIHFNNGVAFDSREEFIEAINKIIPYYEGFMKSIWMADKEPYTIDMYQYINDRIRIEKINKIINKKNLAN